MTKPPPIRVGVEGIEPRASKSGAAAIDWSLIARLPPFQMFLNEKAGIPANVDQDAYALHFATTSADGPALLQEYERWHAAKGLWPNETPLGQVKEG